MSDANEIIKFIAETLTREMEGLRQEMKQGFDKLSRSNSFTEEKVVKSEKKIIEIDTRLQTHIEDKARHEKGYYLAVVTIVLGVVGTVLKSFGIL